MKINKNIFVGLLLVFVLQGYSQKAGSSNLPDVFYKCWIASPEEDISDKSISDTYRPCDHKEFKVGFFRKKIEFFKSGKCKWAIYAPNNPDSLIDCLWFYKGGKIAVKNDKKQTLFKFVIEHLAYNRMNIVVK